MQMEADWRQNPYTLWLPSMVERTCWTQRSPSPAGNAVYSKPQVVSCPPGPAGPRTKLVNQVHPVRTAKLDHKARKMHSAASELTEKRANKVTRGTRGLLEIRERKEKKEQLALMVPQEPQEQSSHLVKTATPENQGSLDLKAKLVPLISQSEALDLLVQQEKTLNVKVFHLQSSDWIKSDPIRRSDPIRVPLHH